MNPATAKGPRPWGRLGFSRSPTPMRICWRLFMLNSAPSGPTELSLWRSAWPWDRGSPSLGSSLADAADCPYTVSLKPAWSIWRLVFDEFYSFWHDPTSGASLVGRWFLIAPGDSGRVA